MKLFLLKNKFNIAIAGVAILNLIGAIAPIYSGVDAPVINIGCLVVFGAAAMWLAYRVLTNAQD